MVKTNASILVPVDGSEYSKRALDKAIELSKKLEAKIDLLTSVAASVAQPPGVILSGAVKGKSATKSIDEYVKKALDEANMMLQENVKYCKNKGVEASYKVISEHPAKAILDYSKKNQNDLIVMGSQGLRGIKKIKVLGSVSRQVLENASCPLVIVH
jgi:nucleotide-binding universal stress UspA family protein